MDRILMQLISISLLLSTFFLYAVKASELEKGVTLSNDTINKTYLTKRRFGPIVNLEKIRVSNSKQKLLAVSTQNSVHLLSPDTYEDVQVIRSKANRHNKGKGMTFGLNPSIMHVDGQYMIVKGGGGYGDVGLMSEEGNKLWTFHPRSFVSPSDMLHADLNSDDEIEFYAIDNSSLYRLDRLGNTVWEVLAPRYFVFRSDFTDLDVFWNKETSRNELVALENDTIHRYDSAGNLLQSSKSKLSFINFQMLNWNGRQLIFAGYFDNKVAFLNIDGSIHEFIDLHDFTHYHEPQAISVKLKKDEADYLVVLSHSKSSSALTLLSIISPESKLIYQEILNKTKGLISLQPDESETEILVIGLRDGLVSYGFN
jgi:translation elongation factor P/translation initiation factor 5A